MKPEPRTFVGDNIVAVDRSCGQGHCWRMLLREEIPGEIILEIEGEMVEGGNGFCPDYVASNGLHYRWI